MCPTGNSQWAHVCSQCLALSKCNTFLALLSYMRIRIAATSLRLMVSVGVEKRSVHIRTGQDTCAVEVVDFRRKRIADLHVRDCVALQPYSCHVGRPSPRGRYGQIPARVTALFICAAV